MRYCDLNFKILILSICYLNQMFDNKLIFFIYIYLSFFFFTCSDLHSQSTSKKVENGSSLNLVDIGARDQEKQLTCCADCSTKFQNEVRILQSSNSDQSTTSSNLPLWFQSYKDNNNNNIDNNKRLGSNDKVIIIIIHQNYCACPIISAYTS